MLGSRDGLITDSPWHGFVGDFEVWEFAGGGLGYGYGLGYVDDNADSGALEKLGLRNDDSLADTIRRVFEICDGVD